MRTPIPMKLHRPTHTLLALVTLTLLSCSTSLPSPSKDEIRATATWFESLDSPDTDVDSKITNRVIELSDAVTELLAELRRPKDEEEERRSHFWRKTSARTAVFVLARCCARQGRADLAEQLDGEVMTLGADPEGRSRQENVTFRAGIEKEIAHALMWKAVVDCGDAS